MSPQLNEATLKRQVELKSGGTVLFLSSINWLFMEGSHSVGSLLVILVDQLNPTLLLP